MRTIKPLVSVVTVCYNAEEVIEKTIKSVIEQDYENLEYIIIDGQSTDKTAKIISKYIDKVSLFISEKDNGIYDAMNKGIHYSKGEWINFMNAGDTFASNNTISTIIKQKENDSEILYGDTIVCTKLGEKYKQCTNPFWKNKSFVHGKGICHQSMFTYNKLAKENKFDTKYKINADYKMAYDLYNRGHKFQYLNYPIAKYEVEEGFSKRYAILSYKEVGSILQINKTIKFKIYYLCFMIKEKLRLFLSRSIKKYFPNLFIQIKKKRL